MSIEVIRYFSNNDNAYLIYSLNENDEAGYTKLYASKIIGDSARIIIDDDEWILIKEIIKDIVKNNRDGNPLNIIDLNEEDLENITLEDNRIFKLQGNLVNLLSENKNKPEEPMIDDIVEEVEEEIIAEEVPEEANFEELYHSEINKVEVLENKIADLEGQIRDLQMKLDQIRELVQE